MAATGARPPFAIAAQNVTACCSAIATSKNLSGYFDANSVSPVPSGIAAVTAVIFLFSLAIAQRYVPKKSDHVSAWGLLSIPVFSSNDDIP